MRRSTTKGKSGSVVRMPGRRDRRLEPRGRRWLVPALAASVLVAAAAGAGTWRVDEVRVRGVAAVPAETIVRAAGVDGGEHMLLLRARTVAERVERIPEVRLASVERTLRGALVVHVVERLPLVRLDAQPELGVDAEGRMFAVSAEVELPVIVGWRGRPGAGNSVDARSRLILREYALFPDALRSAAHTVASGERLTLGLADGVEVRFGELRDLEAKARAAMSVLTIAQESGDTLEYVDVRTPTSPVAKPRGGPLRPVDNH